MKWNVHEMQCIRLLFFIFLFQLHLVFWISIIARGMKERINNTSGIIQTRNWMHKLLFVGNKLGELTTKQHKTWKGKTFSFFFFHFLNISTISIESHRYNTHDRGKYVWTYTHILNATKLEFCVIDICVAFRVDHSWIS